MDTGDLQARGLIQDTSADLDKIFSQTRTIYIGTDPTADSLHVGHLSWVLLMKRFGLAGHNLVFLVGGGTGMIGDPKKQGERPLLDLKSVESNTLALKTQLSHLLEGSSFKMVDNTDWLLGEKLISFLRDIGKHFTINDLIKRDIVRNRLESMHDSISYTEFTYPLLQAYDYLILHRTLACDLQIGGSDQWTNLISGVDLIRKKERKEVFALTIPLVTDESGRKFGKSEGNAVWLDPKKTSPYTFYQFWLNQSDMVMEKYLKIYTFISINEIQSILMQHMIDPSLRIAQKKLAAEVTEIVHGKEITNRVMIASALLFGDVSLGSLSQEEREMILKEALVVRIKYEKILLQYTIVELLVDSNLASSKSEARRFIQAKSVYLNDINIENVDGLLQKTHFFAGNIALLKRGKKIVVLTVEE